MLFRLHLLSHKAAEQAQSDWSVTHTQTCPLLSACQKKKKYVSLGETLGWVRAGFARRGWCGLITHMTADIKIFLGQATVRVN